MRRPGVVIVRSAIRVAGSAKNARQHKNPGIAALGQNRAVQQSSSEKRKKSYGAPEGGSADR